MIKIKMPKVHSKRYIGSLGCGEIFTIDGALYILTSPEASPKCAVGMLFAESDTTPTLKTFAPGAVVQVIPPERYQLTLEVLP